jgi:hypothetical protein
MSDKDNRRWTATAMRTMVVLVGMQAVWPLLARLAPYLLAALGLAIVFATVRRWLRR